MNFELTGTIKLIAEKEVFKSGFEKVEFVLTTNDIKYPEDVKFEVKGDKTDAFINDFNQGDLLTVFFNIRGNEYQNKHYVNLSAWKFVKLPLESITKGVGVLKKDTEQDLPF